MTKRIDLHTEWLSFAAAPTFAAMAVVTGSSADALCATAGGGMATMYLTMAAFHIGPWLRLILLGFSPPLKGEG